MNFLRVLHCTYGSYEYQFETKEVKCMEAAPRRNVETWRHFDVNVELAVDDQFAARASTVDTSRAIESQRPALSAIRVHTWKRLMFTLSIVGENGAYEVRRKPTMMNMNMGGSGCCRVRVPCGHVGRSAVHWILDTGYWILDTGYWIACCMLHASVNGFPLSGGAQRSDMKTKTKTNIHHIEHGAGNHEPIGTKEYDWWSNRSTGSFRGRIRVEQGAQQTDNRQPAVVSCQLSRTILLSDKALAWAVPSLEIIAGDVQCTHGATVSDFQFVRRRTLLPAVARLEPGVHLARNLTCSCTPLLETRRE
jgi:hypothetical protein